MNDSTIEPAVVRATNLHTLLGTGRTQGWKLSKAPGFPRPVLLGPKARGYVVTEIRNWLANHAARG